MTRVKDAVPEEPKNIKDQEHPIIGASWFSRVSLWWMTGLFLKAYKGSITQDDLYPTLDWCKAEKNGREFEERWNKLSMEEKLKKGSLFKQLLLHFKGVLGIGLLIELIAESGRFATPMLIAVVMQYLDGSGVTSPALAYACTALIVVFTLALVPMHSHYFLFHTYIGMLMRSACASLIYKKVLTISNKSKRQVSTGQIVSLMSTEIETFHWCTMTLHAIVFMPLTLIAFIIFGVITTGYAIIVGFAVTMLFIGTRFLMGNLIGKYRRTQESWTRKRVNLMSEIITAMKVIKMYCWEKPFSRRAKEIRREEMKENFKRTAILTTGLGLGYQVVTYVVYSMQITMYLLDHDITPASTVRLIGFLRGMLLTTFIVGPMAFGMAFEALGSTEHIKKFLMTEDYIQEPLASIEKGKGAVVKLSNATAKWDEDAKNNEGLSMGPTLKGIKLTIKSEEVVAVTGKVGSGKSSLIMAILGELALSEGERQVRGSIAYVPQESWVVSDTFRSNILMDAQMDEDRYNKVLKACALDTDIASFPNGDLTPVGERGLSLSGGQKARLNLARAVYQDADIFLLDDPLAAVDGKVGQHIFQNCIKGLLKPKLCILVTHNLQYLPLVNRIAVLEEGEIVVSGSYNDISDKLINYVDTPTENTSGNTAIETPKEEKSQLENDVQQSKTEGNLEIEKSDKENKSPTPSQPNGMETSKQVVQFDVMMKYAKAGNGEIFLALAFFVLVIVQGADISFGWVLSQWISIPKTDNGNITSGSTQSPLSGYSGLWFIGVSGAIAVLIIISGQINGILHAIFLIRASRRLYNSMFNVILRAPMYFFETNPVGQVLNRFSRDTGFMDMVLAVPFNQSIMYLSSAITMAIYACVIFPMMTVLATVFLLLTLAFVHFALYLVRGVKNLEGSLRSPTYSHLSATLQGLTVIRAFRKQDTFLAEAHRHIDRHTAAWHTYLNMMRFVGIRIDFYSSTLIVIYILTTVITATPGENINAGSAGLAFIYLLNLLGQFQFGFVQFSECINMLTSVERIQQFGSLEQEAPEHTDTKPPASWPSKGHIQFNGMTLFYKAKAGSALGPLSLNIKAGEKVGVVGRTGAGKSSLFVSLLRMVEPSGSIKIDGVEVTKLGLTDLRSNISVIPQDPVLFTGSLRLNLDPFEEYTDENLWTALKQVQLHNKVAGLSGGLTAETGEAGDNFSVGEKQLLCMARALLRKNKIIIVDEATANVDYRTDRIIQETLSTEFAGSTVLTIAHRLNTIISYDNIMVLQAGKLVEYDHPHILLKDSSGVFHQMMERLGDKAYRDLYEKAALSYNSRHMETLGPLETVPLDEDATEMSTLSLDEDEIIKKGEVNLAFKNDNDEVSLNISNY